MNAELEEYKERVRKEAIRVAQEQEWCDEGLNGTLERLGLPLKQSYRVPLTVVTRRTVWAEVQEANSQEEAEALTMDPVWRGQNGFDYPEVELAKAKDPEDQRPGDIDTTYTSGQQCRATLRRRGYYCSRERGHGGQHIAGNSETVIETWPQEAD